MVQSLRAYAAREATGRCLLVRVPSARVGTETRRLDDPPSFKSGTDTWDDIVDRDAGPACGADGGSVGGSAGEAAPRGLTNPPLLVGRPPHRPLS